MSEQHSGGKLIEVGKYGCVFDTIPRCRGQARSIRDGRFSKDKRRTRRLVKIMATSDKTILAEVKASHDLSHIPNYTDYFIIVDDVCIGDDMSQDPDWTQCFLLNPGQPRHTIPFVQLRMKYGGIKLSEYALDINKLLRNWVNIQIHLAEGLRILHSRNWVHGDFHFGNILVDDKNIPRIIDFGLSYNLNRLQEKDVITMSFIPSYDNYAPELDYISGMLKRVGSKREIVEQIYYRKKILQEIEETFPSEKGIVSELMGFAERINLDHPSDVVDFIKRWGKASDMWTFGFDFFKLYMLMLPMPAVIGSDFYKLYHANQMRILRGLLHPDPRQRFNVDDLLTELYSLRMSIN